MSAPEALQNTISQNERIYDALTSAGISTRAIQNPNGEMLGVIGNIGSLPVDTTPAVQRLFKRDNLNEATWIRNVLPMSGEKIYPRQLLDIADLAVTTALQEPDMRATSFKSRATPDTQATSRKGESINLHVDFLGSGRYNADVRLRGLNLHFTQWGSSLVRLGLLRSLDETELMEASLKDLESGQRHHQDAAYKRLAAPFTEPFELHSGELLIFQAGQQTERKMAGTAHHFTTISDSRRSDVFIPSAEPASQVTAERQAAVDVLQLERIGY